MDTRREFKHILCPNKNDNTIAENAVLVVSKVENTFRRLLSSKKVNVYGKQEESDYRNLNKDVYKETLTHVTLPCTMLSVAQEFTAQ